MENSKKFIKEQGLLPTISFKNGQAHIVQLIQDKQKSITDDKGEKVVGMAYKVVENGEPKKFFTASADLITQLAEMPEKTTVQIQMKKKSMGGKVRSYYEVDIVSDGSPSAGSSPSKISKEDIPVLEEEDYFEEPSEDW